LLGLCGPLMNAEQRDGRVCGQNYRLLVRGCGFRHMNINGKIGEFKWPVISQPKNLQ